MVTEQSGVRPQNYKIALTKNRYWLGEIKIGLTNAQIGALFKMKPQAISMAALGFENKA